MTFMEVVLNLWICDGCRFEVLVPDDGLPIGWVVDTTGDDHLCADCCARVLGALEEPRGMSA